MPNYYTDGYRAFLYTGSMGTASTVSDDQPFMNACVFLSLCLDIVDSVVVLYLYLVKLLISL